MISFSKEQLDAKWDFLGPEIREAILSGKIDELADNAASKHNLPHKSEDITTLCIYAVHGLLDQNTFFSELTALVGPDASPMIAKDLISEVIIPVISLKPADEDLLSPIETPAPSEDAKKTIKPEIPHPVEVKTATPSSEVSPFVIHAEVESVVPVIETKKTLSEPVRPQFYEEKRVEESIAPPSYAKLQFTPQKPAPSETSPIRPDFSEKPSDNASESSGENGTSLKDLPIQ